MREIEASGYNVQQACNNQNEQFRLRKAHLWNERADILKYHELRQICQRIWHQRYQQMLWSNVQGGEQNIQAIESGGVAEQNNTVLVSQHLEVANNDKQFTSHSNSSNDSKVTDNTVERNADVYNVEKEEPATQPTHANGEYVSTTLDMPNDEKRELNDREGVNSDKIPARDIISLTEVKESTIAESHQNSLQNQNNEFIHDKRIEIITQDIKTTSNDSSNDSSKALGSPPKNTATDSSRNIESICEINIPDVLDKVDSMFGKSCSPSMSDLTTKNSIDVGALGNNETSENPLQGERIFKDKFSEELRLMSEGTSRERTQYSGSVNETAKDLSGDVESLTNETNATSWSFDLVNGEPNIPPTIRTGIVADLANDFMVLQGLSSHIQTAVNRKYNRILISSILDSLF